MNFFLLINVKMPTIVGILTFMSRKNSLLHLSEPDKSWISWYFYTYEHLKFHAQLSWAQKKFYNLRPWSYRRFFSSYFPSVSLPTAASPTHFLFLSRYMYPPIVLIWLKYCWKGHKNTSHPSILKQNNTSSIFLNTSGSAIAVGASSMIFWCLLCIEQSLPNRDIALPYLSPMSWTSRWRACIAIFIMKIGEPGTSVWTCWFKHILFQTFQLNIQT